MPLATPDNHNNDSDIENNEQYGDEPVVMVENDDQYELVDDRSESNISVQEDVAGDTSNSDTEGTNDNVVQCPRHSARARKRST